MTTLMIDDELSQQARQIATQQGKTLEQFVSDVLRGAITPTRISREERSGVEVITIIPPLTIDPKVVRAAIEEEGL